MARNRNIEQKANRRGLHMAGAVAPTHLSASRKAKRADAAGDGKVRGRLVRYTLAEIRERVARGEGKTDWERLDKMTEADIEAAIASDPDERDLIVDWSSARYVSPAELLLRGEHAIHADKQD